MSKLEDSAKSSVIPLIQTRRFEIQEQEASRITQWATLKILTAEGNPRNPKLEIVTSKKEREDFKSSLSIPKNLRIWIARCGHSGWQEAYKRHTACLTADLNNEPEGWAKNIYSSALGLGDLFVYGIYAPFAHPSIRPRLNTELVLPLYPYAGPINWPPYRSISLLEANALADSLEDVFRGQHTIWVDSKRDN